MPDLINLASGLVLIMKVWLILLGILPVLAGAALPPVVLDDGRTTVTDYQILHLTAQRITIMSATGVQSLPWGEVPPELQSLLRPLVADPHSPTARPAPPSLPSSPTSPPVPIPRYPPPVLATIPITTDQDFPSSSSDNSISYPVCYPQGGFYPRRGRTQAGRGTHSRRH